MVTVLVFIGRCWRWLFYRHHAESMYQCMVWGNTLRKVL